MNTLNDWAREHKCNVNKNKTKIVQIRKTKINYPIGQIICEYRIESSYKYLGKILDCSLTMQEEIQALKSKVSKITNMSFKF